MNEEHHEANRTAIFCTSFLLQRTSVVLRSSFFMSMFSYLLFTPISVCFSLCILSSLALSIQSIFPSVFLFFLFLSDVFCALMCESIRVGSLVPPAVCLLSRRRLRPTERGKTRSSTVPDGKVFILPETYDSTTLRPLLP